MQIAVACISAGMSRAEIPAYIAERLVSLTTRTPKLSDQQVIRYLAAASDISQWRERQPETQKKRATNLIDKVRAEMRDKRAANA